MRMNLKKWLLVALLPASFGMNTAKAGETDSPAPKAILETSQSDGFRLSDKAIKTLGLVMNSVPTSSEDFPVPTSAIVHSLDKVGVYRFRNGWFKFIPTSELVPGDQIVVQGVALLRVAEMEAFGGGE